MTKQTIDLKLTIKTDETTLREIQNKFLNLDDSSPNLPDAIAAIVQQALVAAGITGALEIDLKMGQVKRDFGTSGGGLNAEEWLEGN